MKKTVNRYFAGAMKAQQRWLNKMSDKGWRLTGTTIAGYELEGCESGKYEYAVEYVGNKSKEGAESYAKFLEDCGYRVFFKNMNLNYNFGKTVYKPWAEKGGRLATNNTTLNKELLIVEKERDGRPFELHTTAEDRLAYMKALVRPWIWFAAVWLIPAILTRSWTFLIPSAPAAIGVAVYLVKIGKIKKEMRIKE